MARLAISLLSLLLPGCRQVRMGGQWLNDNGLRVVCDRKKN
jgi:hypothetical protein